MTTEIVTVGWQSVKDCLPPEKRHVLATDMEEIYVAFYEDRDWWDAQSGEELDYHITHWMELPELPEN